MSAARCCISSKVSFLDKDNVSFIFAGLFPRGAPFGQVEMLCGRKVLVKIVVPSMQVMEI